MRLRRDNLTQKQRLEQPIASLHRLISITFEADYVEQILEIYLRYINFTDSRDFK